MKSWRLPGMPVFSAKGVAARLFLGLAAAFFFLLLSPSPLTAASQPGADGPLRVSQAEALDWIRDKTGKGIDYDGSYGAQSVDLIKAYYAYLGAEPARGNALSYIDNELPEGFSRLKGEQPRPGDILLYAGGNAGHVGIYESDFVTYHQGWGSSFVIRLTSHYGDIGKGHGYWGVIRPSFLGGSEEAAPSAPPAMSLSDWNAPGVLAQGASFTPEGQVASDRPITELLLGVYDTDGNEALSFKARPMTSTFSLSDIARTVSFERLKSGVFEYRLMAGNDSGTCILASAAFAVRPDSRTVPDGLFKIASSLNRNYMLTVAGRLRSEGANIRLFRYLPYDSTEDFMLKYEGEGLYRIVNNDSGLCLTIGEEEEDGGRNVFQAAQAEDGRQLFCVLTDGADNWYFLSHAAPELALTIHGGRVYDTANIRVEAVDMGASQQFKLFDARSS